MKRFLVGFIAWAVLAFTLSPAVVRAQDSSTQQQLDQIRGALQDVQETQRQQTKRLQELEKDISDMRDKSSGGAGASQEDLQKLADQLQEIDKKRQEDKALILKEIEKLGRGGSGSGSGRKPTPNVSPTTSPGDTATSSSGGAQKGYNYTIQKGDTVNAISKAYREQGIKVTSEQILKANPGLNEKNLIVGKTIFIPAPGQ